MKYTEDEERCSCCGGLLPPAVEEKDEYLVREDAYCMGSLAVDETGRVVGCGAWRPEAYEEEEEEECASCGSSQSQ